MSLLLIISILALKNSIEFQFLEKVFFEQHYRLEEYDDALFISVSTLKKVTNKN